MIKYTSRLLFLVLILLLSRLCFYVVNQLKRINLIPRAKDEAADPHHIASFFNSNKIIAAHAHG